MNVIQYVKNRLQSVQKVNIYLFTLLVLLVICIVVIIHVPEGYVRFATYKVYGENPLGVPVPEFALRQKDLLYPYKWAYRGNNFPLEKIKEAKDVRDFYGYCECGKDGRICLNNCNYGSPICGPDGKCMCGGGMAPEVGCRNKSQAWC
jgi:hypothetical protein